MAYEFVGPSLDLRPKDRFVVCRARERPGSARFRLSIIGAEILAIIESEYTLYPVSYTHLVPLELRRHGISLEEACDELVEDGVQQFADAFDQMFGEIGRRRRIFLEGPRPRMEIAPGSPEMRSAFEQESEIWRKEGRVRRLWAGDSSLWSGTVSYTHLRTFPELTPAA